jgi:hypothetical protein
MIQKFIARKRKPDDPYLKGVPTFDIIGGTNLYDPPYQIQDTELSKSYNVFTRNKKVVKRFGYKTFANGLPLPSPVIQFEQFYKYDGSDYLCCFTLKDIYVYNTASGYWDLKTPNLLVDDCETAWTAKANVTATADTTWFRYGAKSAKLAIAAGFTTGIAATMAVAAKDLHTYTYLHFYIKSSIAQAAGDLQIMLDNTAACASPIETINLPALSAGVATEVEVALAAAASDTAIISVGLKIATDNGACDIYLDDIRAVKCYTGTVNDRWATEMIYDSDNTEVKFIATNKVDAVQYWNGTGNWADLPGTVGSPNKAKVVLNYYHYLLLMNCVVGGVSAPQRIEWCVEGRPTHWTDAGSGNNSLAQTADFIIGAEFLQGNVAIFKGKSITLMNFTGLLAPFYFDELRVLDVGLMSKDTIQSLGTDLLFLGWDCFYTFDSFNCKPVGRKKVSENIIETINPAAINTIFSHVIDQYGLCLFFLPSGASDYPDMAWCYDYNESTFYLWKFNDPITAAGYYSSTSKVTIGQLLSKIGTLNWRLGSRSLSNLAPISLLGDYNGYTYQIDYTEKNDNGVAVDAYFDTRNFITLGQYTRLEELDVYGIGSGVYVQFSVDNGKTWGEEHNLGITPLVDKEFLRNLKITSEKVMMRFGNREIDGWFELEGWIRKYIEKDIIRA